MLNDAFSSFSKGSYSPKYLGPAALETGTHIMTEEENERKLLIARQKVLGQGTQLENAMTPAERALHNEARKGMNDDEVQFSVESTLENEVYLWSDKYRPRKPRYFNRWVLLSGNRKCSIFIF
jgi:hypothetical protein